MLRSRIYDHFKTDADKERQQTRTWRKIIGSGDRSERIRTYNFPQNRLTDHRINLTLYNLDRIILGDLDEIVDALIDYDSAAEGQGAPRKRPRAERVSRSAARRTGRRMPPRYYHWGKPPVPHKLHVSGPIPVAR